LRIPKLPMIVVLGIVIVLAYFATVGWASPVPDFEPEDPTDEPELPSGDPIKYVVFQYSISVFSLVAGQFVHIDPMLMDFYSMDEGRIYDNKQLFVSPFPDPPTDYKAQVTFTITGSDYSERWTSDYYEIPEFPTNVTDVSGRAFFYLTGTYSWTATLNVEAGMIGDRIVATQSGTLEVD